MVVTGCLNAGWKIKLLIANSATWQALLGTNDPMVHTINNAVEEQSVPFPRCIVNDTSEGGSIEFTRNELGGFNRLANILATFEYQVPEAVPAATIQERSDWVTSTTGAIISDIVAMVAPPLAEVGGEYPINVTGFSITEGPNQVSWEELDQVDLWPSTANKNLPVWFHTVQFTSGP